MTTSFGNQLSRAVTHLQAGRLREADLACAAVLEAQPVHADALEIRGLIAAQSGNYPFAVSCFQDSLKHAARRSPATLSNLAEALLRLNRPDDGIAALREAIMIAPDYAIAHGKLAVVLNALGRTQDALQACRTGLQQAPQDAELNGVTAGLLLNQNEPAQAIAHLYIALEGAPQIEDHWSYLYRVLLIGFLPWERAHSLLLSALEHPLMRPAMIAPSIATTLARSPLIAELFELQNELPDGNVLAHCLNRLGGEPLLLALMAVTPVPEPQLEALFTALRRALLAQVDALQLSAAALQFCVALANQAFLTEYAWYVSDRESAQIDTLRTAAFASPDMAVRLVVTACYVPLYLLEQAAAIKAQSWPDQMLPLIRMQIDEPALEHELSSQVQRLTAISDAVSRQVRAQYEQNPYPRWVRAERLTRQSSLPALIRSLGGAPPSDDPTLGAPDVLIAGCGTGQQVAIAASRYAEAKIVAVDISRASLAYAARKTGECGLQNVRYVQGDLLELGVLRHQFHVIECSGVLHHLRDPLAGWRILNHLLRPGGLMNVGLYSARGRQAIVAAREYIAARGYEATVEDIRRCRRDILSLPEDHALAALWRGIDFYNISACRDLLFHSNEHRFTLLQIRDALEELGLRFLRFELMDYSNYQRRFPDDRQMRSLNNWHRLEQEQPDTFSGMYQFWVQKP